MDLGFSAEELAFRNEVRDFVAKNLPANIRDKLASGRHPGKDDIVTWTRILAKRGWSVPHWPKEWGGTGWDPIRLVIFNDEIQRGHAPELLAFGSSMVGPVIYTFGSQAQKERFLPRIADLRDWWCQGFSEPGAGSDLAGLRTSAKREGESLGHQRTEDLDDARPTRRLDLRARAHRRFGEEAGGHFVLPRRHEDAGRHS